MPALHVGAPLIAISTCSDRPRALGRMVVAARRSIRRSSASASPCTSEPYTIPAMIPVVKTLVELVPMALVIRLSLALRRMPWRSLAAADLAAP